MNKKLIWGIVIVIVVVAGIAYFNSSVAKPVCWPYCENMTDQDREKIKESAISDWKTYIDPQNVLSFKYPSGWVKYEGNFAFFGTPDYKSAQLHIVTDDIKTQTLNEYLKQSDLMSKTAYEGQPSKNVLSSKQITIAGRDAIQREEASLSGAFTAIYTYVKVGNTIFNISIIPNSKDTTPSVNDKLIYDKILSTLKFTSPLPINPTK